MKKLILSMTMCAALGCAAQTLHVEQSNVIYSFPAAQTGEMQFLNSGSSLMVIGREFALTAVDKMYVDDNAVDDNTVTVTYAGTTATVEIAGNIAQYVDATVDGAYVTIAQSSDVSDDTCGEITYILSGQSDAGCFAMSGSFKASIDLEGLTLTNPSGAALAITNGKRIKISAKSGTTNTLTDGSGSQKGCIECKGHLEFKGKGSLTVAGNYAHAIYAKEYVEMKNCTLTVTSAVKDGINCNQYFLIESGTLNISGVGDDGIQVSYKDDEDREAEDTGTATFEGGTVTVNVTADASKGIKTEGDIIVNDGTINVTVTGGGVWDEDKVKTKAAAAFGSDGSVNIAGGTITLTATGGGGKGINADTDFVMTGGELTISTSGGMYAYVNGKEYQSYTGNSDNLDSDYKSSPKGAKVDGDVIISGGTIKVTTTGNGGEGIESKSTLTINDGTIYIVSKDDAINSSSHMYIKGGDITVVATGNDGLDSNGNMYISGGTIRAFGTTSPECGIDANEEEGYSVIFTGGMLLAVGGGNSVPSTSESTQPYVTTTTSVKAGNTIAVKSGSTTLASFVVPDEYGSSSSSSQGGGFSPGGNNNSSSSVLISCPGLQSGSSYTLTSGSSSSTVTAKTTGSSNSRP